MVDARMHRGQNKMKLSKLGLSVRGVCLLIILVSAKDSILNQLELMAVSSKPLISNVYCARDDDAGVLKSRPHRII